MNFARISLPARAALLTACAVALAGPAWGQAVYRSVGPDGRVTFSDRPPPDGRGSARVLPFAGPAAGPVEGLPAPLQRIAERFPVVLYTAPNCAACDEGRRMLVGRGIPYTESTISSAEDIAALEGMAGERTVPLLRIGGQLLRGWSSGQWSQYLDAAGYPERSTLPASWVGPPPTPLGPRRSPPQPAGGSAPAPASEPATVAPAPPPPADGPTPSNPAGIRF